MNISLTESVRDLAEKNGTSFYRIEKELHIGNGTIADWDIHRPSIDKVAAVADYFMVSIDSLCGRASDGFMSEEEKRLLQLFRSMNAEGQAFLMQSAEMASGRFLKTSTSDNEGIA